MKIEQACLVVGHVAGCRVHFPAGT